MFDAKLKNSDNASLIDAKFSALLPVGVKNIRANFPCKRRSPKSYCVLYNNSLQLVILARLTQDV